MCIEVRLYLGLVRVFSLEEVQQTLTNLCCPPSLLSDLKPENILLNASDIDVKITDFGVAKSASGGLKTLVGTPGYLAPEILKRRHTVLGQGRYGKSADLWSLGVILYILLSGTPPFDVDGVQDMDVILQTGNKVQFPAKLWKDISPEAIDLVKHLLVMDPLKRISIREACEHPWVLMEDGDTHRHPLEDPKLLSKTKKRLFSGASPVPTPASNRSKATSGGSKDPVSKRLKLEVESAAQTTRIPEAATVKTCEEANSKAKGDCPSTSTHPSSTDKSDIQQIQSEKVEEEDFRRTSEARDIDKDMHNIDSTSNSKNPPEKTVGITNQREKVSPTLSESLIDRIMQPKPTCNKQKSSTKTLAETSNIVDKKPLEKKSESIVVEDEHEKSEMEIETALPARDPENSDNGNVGSPNQSSMALEEIQTPEEEKRRKVTPGVSNKEKFPTNTSSTKFSQATQHFEPGSFTVAAVAAQKPKRSKKSKEKGLVEAAELEEDEICSQFSDDDTESITSFGDAINIEKETQIEEEKDISKPSGKTYKQSTLAPLSGTSSVSAKKEKAPTSKTTRSSKASKPKVAKTAAKPRKSAAAEKKTTTTTAKKSISRTINDKKSGTSKDSSTKEAASSDGVGGGEEGRKKSPKQTTLSKWFQLSKQSKSDSS